MSIRFAILGAGRIGQVHARAVDGNDKAVLAATWPLAEIVAAQQEFSKKDFVGNFVLIPPQEDVAG